MTFSDLSKSFQEATNYAAEIFYVGQLPFETVHQLLNTHLPLKQTELAGTSPQEKEKKKYENNRVLVYHDSKAKQSRIVFYTDGPLTSPANAPERSAFNTYFTRGFGGLVQDVIRVQNSMAYTSYGVFNAAETFQKPGYFIGFIGTQSDKTNKAIDLFMDLVRDMPENDYRMPDIRNYLINSSISMKPHFRSFATKCEEWKRQGFEQMPAKVLIPEYEQMEFADIVDFYEQNLKDKPVVIGIVGNTSDFDLDALEKYGEVERLREKDIFGD
jgi:predicted Zn-dependent peptidase